MSRTYEIIADLCRKKGVNMTKMCKESGAPRGSMTDLKNGRIESLSLETLQKIASYFGVDTDYLVKGANSRKEISDTELKIALFGGDIDDKAWCDVKQFVEFVRQKYKSGDDNGHFKT